MEREGFGVIWRFASALLGGGYSSGFLLKDDGRLQVTGAGEEMSMSMRHEFI